MKKWEYTLINGKELRNEIANDNAKGVINALKKCYNEILNNYKFIDDYDRTQFEDACEYLNGDIEIIEDCESGLDNIEEYGFEDIDELVNDRLTEFYDLCDDFNIWVGI